MCFIGRYNLYKSNLNQHFLTFVILLKQFMSVNQEPEIPIYYVNEKDTQQFNCPICKTLMTKTYDINCGNGHLFCQHCISRLQQQMINENNSIIPCPQCRMPSNINYPIPCLFVDRLISQIKVYCPNKIKKQQQRNIQTIIKQESKEEEYISNSRSNYRSYSRLRSHSHSRSHYHSPSPSRSPSRSRSRSRSSRSQRIFSLEENCEWKGDLIDLKDHYNQCKFTEIQCQYCNDKITKYLLEEHNYICSNYPINCELDCGKTIKRNKYRYHKYNECINRVIECPYKCGNDIQIKYLQKHYNECDKFIIECQFKKFGCCFKKTRKEVRKHNKDIEIVSKHMLLIGNFVNKKILEIKDGQKNLKQEIDDLYSRNMDDAEYYDARFNGFDMRINDLQEDINNIME